MKKIYAIITLLVLIPAGLLSAQNYTGTVIIEQVHTGQKGDSLYIDMTVSVNGKAVYPDQSMRLIPVIRSEQQAKILPAITINGTHRHKVYKRQIALTGQKPDDYAAIKVRKKQQAVCRYTVAIPYENWMQGADVLIHNETCGCAGEKQNTSINLLAGKINLERPLPEQKTPYIAYLKPLYIVPEVEVVKIRNEKIEAYLSFPTGKTGILPQFKNNTKELDKIHRAIAGIENEERVALRSIVIEGYASPEGTYAANLHLSAERAAALKTLIMRQYAIPEKFFTVKGCSEDWKRLEMLIKQSDLAGKEEALSIIRNKGVFNGREKALMALNGGKTYKELSAHFFPLLRRCDFTVEYSVKAFTIEEGLEIVRTRPALLSLNEMYLIAQTYQKNSEEFRKLVEEAVRLFPEDAVANINAAAMSLEKQDLAAAEKYLSAFEEDRRAWNNLGILFYLKGDKEKAMDYFERSWAAGYSEGIFNMKECEKTK